MWRHLALWVASTILLTTVLTRNCDTSLCAYNHQSAGPQYDIEGSIGLIILPRLSSNVHQRVQLLAVLLCTGLLLLLWCGVLLLYGGRLAAQFCIDSHI